MDNRDRVLGDLRETKISNLMHTIIDKNIGNLQISMDNILLSQILESFVDIDDNIINIFLPELPHLPKLSFQIAPITQLRNNIAIPNRREYLLAAYHIWVG